MPEEPPADLQTLKQAVETYLVAFHHLQGRFLALPPLTLASRRADDGRAAIAEFYTAADEPARQATVDRLGRAHAALDGVVAELRPRYPAPYPVPYASGSTSGGPQQWGGGAGAGSRPGEAATPDLSAEQAVTGSQADPACAAGRDWAGRWRTIRE